MATLERCDSLAVLMENEQPIHVDNLQDSDCEDGSSGYDSASDGLSDNDHNNNQILDLIQETKSSRGGRDKTKEKMCFQNTSALSNHLKYIMSMPDLCDVRFLVGEDKVPVYGVKAIMATRSRTFYHLIMKHQKKQEIELAAKGKKKRTAPKHLTIDVKKYDADVFRKIIQFVHCGSVDVTSQNVVGLLCGSSQFGLNDLHRACWDFIGRCVNRDNIHCVLKSATAYSQHKVITRLLNKLASMGLKEKKRSSDTSV